MRIILFLVRKEFQQIFRDFAIVRMILVMPIVQLSVLPQVANYDVKNVQFAVIDHDHSVYARQLVEKISASAYFHLVAYDQKHDAVQQLVEQDKIDLYIEIPVGFERTLVKENVATLFLAVNAINGTKANLGAIYVQSIIRDYNAMIRTQLLPQTRFAEQGIIEVTSLNRFNPLMQYSWFMVPGILIILLVMIGMFLTALNIVKEKEIGTIEQINVTPIKKWQFIVGKLLPFWVIGMVVLSLGLMVSRIVYGIIPVGSLLTIYGFAGIFLCAALGIGLLVSTMSSTLQQAMFIAFFFMMIFMLLGGLYTPIDSMPEWTQWITRVNPVAYGIRAIRMIVMKGSTFMDLLPEFSAIVIFAVSVNLLAILNYRKTT